MPSLGTPVRERAVVTVMVLRAVAAVALAAMLPNLRLRLGLLVALGCTWALAHGYERLRDTPRSPSEVDFNAWVWKIYVIVGGSYAIRAGFGVYLGSDGRLSLVAVAVMAVAFYFSGVATVLMAWTLESTLYVGVRQPRTRLPRPARRVSAESPAADTTRPATDVGSQIGSKLHLLPLALSAGLLTGEAYASARAPEHREGDARPASDDDDVLTDEELPFRNCTVLVGLSSLRHPWNPPFFAACAAAAVGGWVAGGPWAETRGLPWLAALLTGLMLGAIAHGMPSVAAVLSVAALATHAACLEVADRPYDNAFVWFPLTVVVCTYAATRQMTYVDSITVVSKVLQAPASTFRQLRHVVHELVR